jgi:hypothetical protein
MKNKNIIQMIISSRKVFWMISMLTSVASLLIGCSQNLADVSDDHFRTMEVKNKIAYFSFEYRTYYHDTDGPWVDDNEHFKMTYVDILASKLTMPAPNPELGNAGETVRMSYTPASIGFLVSDALNRPFRPAQDRILNRITSWSRWEHFKLLEKKTILVSGIQGEMASYEVDGLIGPKLLYQSNIAFDYNGKEWNINVMADIALTKIVEDDVQHVIDTFKILD